MMKPDDHVQHEAKVNPKLMNKTYRLEPKPNKGHQQLGYDFNITAKDFLQK
jgi:hypothetical protein